MHKRLDQLTDLRFLPQSQKEVEPLTLQEKIAFSKNIRQWPLRFQYIPFNISELSSIFIDSNPKFKELKSMLVEYNDEMKHYETPNVGNRVMMNGPTKQTFYLQLMNLMRQIILTKDRTYQGELIDKVYKWSQDILRQIVSRKTGGDKAPRTKSRSLHHKNEGPESNKYKTETSFDNSRLHTTNYDTSFHHSTRPNTTTKLQEDDEEVGTIKINEMFQSVQPSIAPSQMIDELLFDYRLQARTKHASVDPPNNRLQNFKRRQIMMLGEQYSSKSPTRDQQKLRMAKTTFPKQYAYTKVQNDGILTALKKIQRSQDSQADLQASEPDNQLDDLAKEIEKQKELQKDEKQVSLVPTLQNFKKDLRSQTLYDSSEPKSSFTFYQPRGEVANLRLEKRWKDNRNRELAEKRQDEEMISIMNTWTKNKSRMEKEIHRRIDARVAGSDFLQCNFKEEYPNKSLDEIIQNKPVLKEESSDSDESNPDLQLDEGSETLIDVKQVKDKPQQTRFVSFVDNFPKVKSSQNTSVLDQTIEASIDNKRVSNLRGHYSHLLQLTNDNEDRYVPIGLSVYDRKVLQSKNKTFSEIVQRTNSSDQTRQQLEEIQEIKHRMAKYRLNVPINRLMTAIMVPTSNLKHEYELPHPGFGLLDNPFDEKKKSAKKKKR